MIFLQPFKSSFNLCYSILALGSSSNQFDESDLFGNQTHTGNSNTPEMETKQFYTNRYHKKQTAKTISSIMWGLR